MNMTKEDAIVNLKMIRVAFTDPVTAEQAELIDDTFDMAIKVLEQEPCEDAISRQAVINTINQNCIYENEYNLTAKHIKDAVEQLPPVTPQQKTGRWIEHFDESGKWYECDRCHTDWGGSVNYCPNCGAKMEESEE